MLTLPKAKVADKQRLLFENSKMLSGKGSARSWTGDFFEEATRSYAKGVRLQTDSRYKICPDIWWLKDIYFETKSVGNNGSFILYSCRLKKDQEYLTGKKKSLLYWLWRHEATVHDRTDLYDLREVLAASTRKVVVVTLEEVVAEVGDKPERTVNSAWTKDKRRLGYGKNGYGVGWTIPFNAMLKHCEFRFHYTQLPVYQHKIPTIEFYFSQAAAAIVPCLA